MPGTPGTLSVESPISACTSIDLVRRHAEFFDDLGDGRSCWSFIVSNMITQSLTSCIRSLSDETMVTLAPASQACAHIGRDQIVGLVAVLLEARQVEGAHRFADERELRDADRRAGRAGAPCSRDTFRCGRSSRTCRTPRRDGSACSSGFMSRRSFHSMLQKPNTALSCSPSDLRLIGGSA